MDPTDMDHERLLTSDVSDADAAPASEEVALPVSVPAESSELPDAPDSEETPQPESEASMPVKELRPEFVVTTPLSRLVIATPPEDIAPDVVESEAPAEPERPVEPGDALGGYTIERVLRVEDGEPVYLLAPPPPSAEAAAEEQASHAGDEPPPWRYIARAASADSIERLEHIVAAGASGPGLLAPVAVARGGGRTYLIGVELPGSGAESDQAAAPLGLGERLRPVDALTACSQLATALGELHRVSLAHLHVAPDQVTLYDGRVYLGGVEGATPVTDAEEGPSLYARDANFLARTVGALGGAGDVTLWDHDSSAQRSLREISQRGQTGSFTTVDEVGEASALALQTLMVAGARMGADVRAVRLRVTAGAATSVGRIRSENQDAWAATLFDIHDDAAADSPLGVFLVADGMGGEAHGEIASRLVARIVTAEMARRFLEPQTTWPAIAIFTAASDDADTAPQAPLAEALEQAVKEANRRTRAFGQKLNATTGSTVTALAVSGARAALAHLGDSRAYLLRDERLIQLTEDHSLLARLEAMQHPALEDPAFMVPRSVLYRSVGQDEDTAPDMLQFVLAPGDRIMLCSDGLWDEIEDDPIQSCLSEAGDPASCAADLVALANASGGHDNSTAVVVFVSAVAGDTPFAGAARDNVTGDESGDATGEAENEPQSVAGSGGAEESQ